jgi:hypothetical protein
MNTPPVIDLSNAVFLRRHAIAWGYTDRGIQLRVRAGEWHRVRRGAYVSGPVWRELSETDRHRAQARAVLMTAHPTAVLSHVSAAVEIGAPVWDVDLSVVHVTRTDRKPRRREAGVWHHRGILADDEIYEVNGVRVTVPLRAAVEVPTVVGVEQALVMVDGLLRIASAAPQDVKAALDRATHWPRSLAHEVIFRLADSRHESAAETRTHYMCWKQGLPCPEPQVQILDERGREFARVDFAWRKYGVFLEFDGRIKYERFRRPNESLEDFLMREKRRELRICQLTGWVCVRIGWADLENPVRTAARIQAILNSRRTSA